MSRSVWWWLAGACAAGSVVACSAAGGDGQQVTPGQGGSGQGASGGQSGFGGSDWNPGGAGGVGGQTHFGSVAVRGTIWSPGADRASTLPGNRFPIPGAVVIAHTSPPAPLPQALYCNECVELSDATPHVTADAVDGSFTLRLDPGTWYLTIQKGEFRRVRRLEVVDDGSGVMELDTPDVNGPKPEVISLPSRTEMGLGDNIPKVAIIDGAYEDQREMWVSMGFNYEGEVRLFEPDLFGAGAVGTLLNDYEQLRQFNLLVMPCGSMLPTGGAPKANLERFVREGGKLYIDDFSYDYAEQVWPSFLSYFVRESDSGGQTNFVCGDGATTPQNACNDWKSAYTFQGVPGDADFGAWLRLPSVNPSGQIQLEGAWNSIHQLGQGQIGVDEHGTPVIETPKVWMSGDTPAPGADNPATVSWDYHCGKVLFTVYHTHINSSGGGYQLSLQEKIMMYLIMEIQTCSSSPVVK